MEPDPTFRTTRWTMVLSAGRGDGAPAQAALEDLCRAYWFPLYASARRTGLDHAEAEDAVQGLFADLLSRGDLAGADPARGRFRGWLRAALRHHLANRDRAARAVKRGGGVTAFSLDLSDADERYQAAAGSALSADDLFDRTWALALLDRALAELRQGYEARGKGELFEALAPAITAGEAPLDRAAIAARFEMTDGALKVAVHRLRERYREGLQRVVLDTVDDPEALDSELAELFRALGG